MKIMTQMMKKKEKTSKHNLNCINNLKCKKHNFQIFWCNPNDPNFDIFKFVGEINLYISKLLEKKQRMKWLIKLLKTLKKIVAVTKSKELKLYAKNVLPNYKKLKTHNEN